MAQQSFHRFFTEGQFLFAPLKLTPDHAVFFQALGWDILALTGGNPSSFTRLIPDVAQGLALAQRFVDTPQKPSPSSGPLSTS